MPSAGGETTSNKIRVVQKSNWSTTIWHLTDEVCMIRHSLEWSICPHTHFLRIPCCSFVSQLLFDSLKRRNFLLFSFSLSFESISMLLRWRQYRCNFLSIPFLKYISSTVLPQNLNLPLFFKNWASMFAWAEKREIQIWGNTVEDMYFKRGILKKLHL